MRVGFKSSIMLGGNPKQQDGFRNRRFGALKKITNKNPVEFSRKSILQEQWVRVGTGAFLTKHLFPGEANNNMVA